MFSPDALDWSLPGGLLPAVVQDAERGSVLMLGYMNREAVQLTLDSGRVTFFSRSRQRLWTKGESSGNHLLLEGIAHDCDADALLVRARPAGPTCHLGRSSCFADVALEPVAALDALVATRAAAPQPGSYTNTLLSAGVRRISQKVGEEGVEVALAAVAQDREALVAESADLVYHLLVLLRSRGCGWADVQAELRRRAAA